MKIEILEHRMLIPDTGKWLYHEKDDVVSDKVFLGKESDPNDWTEIDQEEKFRIEKQREAALKEEVRRR